MAGKISEYTVELLTFGNNDLMDVSKLISTGPDVWETEKVKFSTLKAALENNIYSNNGSLLGNRVVTQAGYDLSFQGGNIGFGIAPDSDARTHIQGVDATTSNFALKVKNSASGVILYARNDKTITLLTDSYAVMGGLEPYYPVEFKVGGNRNIWWSSGSSQSSIFIEDGTRQGIIAQLASSFGMVTGTYSNHDFSLRTNNSERIFIDKSGQVVIGGFGASSIVDFNNAQLIINTGLANSINVNGNILLRSAGAPVIGDLFSSPRVVFSSYYNSGSGSTEFKSDIRYVAETTGPTGRLAFSIGGSEYMKIRSSGVIYMNAQVGNAGLVTGDTYKDTAANILANGDYVMGIKA